MNTTKLFFDFYTLSLLRFFAGRNSLNHNSRLSRIEDQFEVTVNDLYSDIRRCLEYSVIREFRHFRTQTHNWSIDNRKKELMDLSDKCSSYHTELNKFLTGSPSKVDNSQGVMYLLYNGFRSVRWYKWYGGKKWAKATSFLLQHPKTVEEKELWIDRVLDLQHNCGHILDKTKYAILSKRNQFKLNEGEGRGGRRTALNYRRYARTISDLYKYSSVRVKKLAIANSNLLPQIIR